MSNRLIFLLAVRFGVLEACGPSACCSCSQGSSGGPSPGKIAAVAGGTAAAGAAAAGLAAAGAATLATTGLVAFGATKAIKGFLNHRKSAKAGSQHDAIVSQNRDVAISPHSFPKSTGKSTGIVNFKIGTSISKSSSSNSRYSSSKASRFTPTRSTQISARLDEQKAIGYTPEMRSRSSHSHRSSESQNRAKSQLSQQSNTSYRKVSSTNESSMMRKNNSIKRGDGSKSNSRNSNTWIDIIEDRHVDVM